MESTPTGKRRFFRERKLRGLKSVNEILKIFATVMQKFIRKQVYINEMEINHKCHFHLEAVAGDNYLTKKKDL